MKKIPSWVWLAVAGAGAYYLFTKYKANQTIALTSATVSAGGSTSNVLPGTPSSVAAAGAQIGQGLSQLFNLG